MSEASLISNSQDTREAQDKPSTTREKGKKSRLISSSLSSILPGEEQKFVPRPIVSGVFEIKDSITATIFGKSLYKIFISSLFRCFIDTNGFEIV
jgi:hypothetical protein